MQEFCVIVRLFTWIAKTRQSAHPNFSARHFQLSYNASTQYGCVIFDSDFRAAHSRAISVRALSCQREGIGFTTIYV
jgi:hypothetical protein